MCSEYASNAPMQGCGRRQPTNQENVLKSKTSPSGRRNPGKPTKLALKRKKRAEPSPKIGATLEEGGDYGASTRPNHKHWRSHSSNKAECRGNQTHTGSGSYVSDACCSWLVSEICSDRQSLVLLKNLKKTSKKSKSFIWLRFCSICL